jgi:hypothetical protein
MIRRLFTISLSRLQLASVIALSAIATIAVIATAGGQTTVAEEAAAMLHRQIVVHGQTVVAAPGGSTSGAGGALLSAGGGASTEVASSGANATPSTSSAGGSGSTSAATTTTATSKTPAAAPTRLTAHAKHVFVIALTTTSYTAAFGRDSVAHYLNRQLRAKGTLLTGYHSLSGSELPDELAMVSGQPANPETRTNCLAYNDFGGGKVNAAGIVTGDGCVYPNTVTTVADQVSAAGKEWKAYIADMGRQSCIHPNSGASDDAVLPFAGSQYDTRHNPFIYFHSLLDLGGCSTNDVSLNELPANLRSAGRTPQYAFISPPLCDDSSASACPDGQPGGLAGEDAFLKAWVPKILASAAYRDKGVLMIVFAPSAAGTGPAHASTTTTTTSTTVTTPATTSTPYAISPGATAALTVPGAGAGAPVRTGALVISSSYATAGRSVAGTFNPDSVLRSVEQLLGLKWLGQAASAQSFVKTALPRF